jgi:hypothetical protein
MELLEDLVVEKWSMKYKNLIDKNAIYKIIQNAQNPQNGGIKPVSPFHQKTLKPPRGLPLHAIPSVSRRLLVESSPHERNLNFMDFLSVFPLL